MDRTKVTICGGGSLGHTVAGYLSGKMGYDVRILTRRPDKWNYAIRINTPSESYTSSFSAISSDPSVILKDAGVIILCLPGTAYREELIKIMPFIHPDAWVGGIFCSGGFFFDALEILPPDIPTWGFQRVPFISRTLKYGEEANLLSFRDSYKIAVENADNDEKELIRKWVEISFSRPTDLLNNYLEASITNSNPLLHTARLFTMFGGYQPADSFGRMIMFYAEWNDEASIILDKMDKELFRLIDRLPVDKNFLVPIMKYYDSETPAQMTAKIRSIEGFKTINSPMKEVDGKWIPDFSSRYFNEDFGKGLKMIHDLAHEYNVDTPTIDMVYEWGISKLKK